jgi:AraC-like DNA-binding protein
VGLDPLSIGIVGAGVVGAGSSLAGSIIGGNAAGDAAAAGLQGTRESIAAQREQSDKAIKALQDQSSIARQDLEPFRQAQVSALGQLQAYADPNSAYFQTQRKQATEAIQRQLAAQGLLRSKNQVDLLSNLETGLQQNQLGVLGGIAGNGAAQSLAGLAQQLGVGSAGIYGGLGQQLGSSFQAGGQIAGQARLGQAQATVGGINGLNNAFQGTLGNFLAAQVQQGQLAQLKALLGGSSAGGFTGTINPAFGRIA